jgi:hypothetical protein
MPDSLDPALAEALRGALDAALAGGLRDDPLAHAAQVAAVAAALWRAFQSVGLECVLVGGSAIEVHAPGLYVTGDVDVVLDGFGRTGVRDTADAVLTALGFVRAGRHWTRGDLFVELPAVTLDDPTELVRVGALWFRVIRKEVLLRDRVVGFLHWRQPAYGQQALDLIAAFDAGELDDAWLRTSLRREGAEAAYDALRALATAGDRPVDVDALERLLDELRRPRRGRAP